MVVAWRCWLLIAGLWSTAAGAAQFTATVDRSELYQDEFLELTLSLTNSETRLRAEGVKPNIDLTLLADQFDLGKPQADFRFNIDRSRGRSTSEIVVQLFPKRSGALVIPPFSVDGLQSERLRIRVLPRAAEKSPEVFLRAYTSKATVWQREQLVIYTDLYHRVALASAKTGGQLETEPPDINIRQLPKSERTELVDGVEYRVARNGWVLFPPRSGVLRVFVPDVWVETAQQRKQRFPAQTVTVDVKTLPADVPSGMVIGKPDIAITALNGDYAVGRMASWNVTVRAPVPGVAMPTDLPLIDFPATLKAYTSKAKQTFETGDAGITGVTTWTLALIPTQSGQLILPAIRFPYFDPERGIIAIAVADGPKLQVSADTAVSAPDDVTQSAPEASTPAEPAAATTLRAWQAAAAIFGTLWLLTVVLLTRRRQPVTAAPSPTTVTSTRPARFAARPLIQEMLDAFDAPTLEEGLAAWEQIHGVDDDLRELIRSLQEYYYGKNRSGSEAALRSAVAESATRVRHTRDVAAPRRDAWAPESFTTRV